MSEVAVLVIALVISSFATGYQAAVARQAYRDRKNSERANDSTGQ